jgi:hypothetical protein
MRLISTLLISIYILSSCNLDPQKMIIGEWRQVYNDPADSKYMGFMIVTFKQNSTGSLQLYSKEGNPDYKIMFTYKVVIDSNYVELTHLPIVPVSNKDDSTKEQWGIKGITKSKLIIEGNDIADLTFERMN